ETGSGPEAITVPTVEALRWATIDGARMAGMDHRVGSLVPGKAADIVLLNARAHGLHPVNDPIASVVLQAGTANVDTVIVDGVVRKRAGRLLAGDIDRRADELAASGARILTEFRAAQG
ncbi:amidohydrolase family protein, partial [Lutimaribacter sp. EGI FJ00014]|nr:amidohydrolase family protein [Lutimaribacter sp. EGI FJ00014]